MAADRYLKFHWYDTSSIPPIGTSDYVPKQGGLFRMYEEGSFVGEHLEEFSAVKKKRKLFALGKCTYCGRNSTNAQGDFPLTSEHIIPEALGAGLALPEASCRDCQQVTAEFESSVIKELFDPVRASYGLRGKNGALQKTHFPLDVGLERSENVFLPKAHHPTLLMLPRLYPASSYSRRPMEASDVFNLQILNVNADPAKLLRVDLERFSSQHIDKVRFAQLIAKIAHVFTVHHYRAEIFIPTVADFIRTIYPPATQAEGYFQHVGCLLQQADAKTDNLHEVEVGKMHWNGEEFLSARVRLFASCDMPSYYVTVGRRMQKI